jgi:hypothetical protein
MEYASSVVGLDAKPQWKLGPLEKYENRISPELWELLLLVNTTSIAEELETIQVNGVDASQIVASTGEVAAPPSYMESTSPQSDSSSK